MTDQIRDYITGLLTNQKADCLTDKLTN